MRWDRRAPALLACLLAATGGGSAAEETTVSWQALAPGMELARLRTRASSEVGDSTITVLRMDPEHWELEVLTLDTSGRESGLTARQWSRQHGLTAATNAGMFATDHDTHVGYLRAGSHVNNGRFNHYQSVAAFGPRSESLPRFRIFDLDVPGTETDAILRDYATVIQNLRLIKRPGENRWSKQEKRWSEAALGEDREGRILFLFCRSPFSMYELNHELLALGIDLVAAQHLEGGPEAQLFIDAGGSEIELVGSYETAFFEDDSNHRAWKVPNILGARPREYGAGSKR